MSLRVFQLISSSGYYGAENMVLALSRSLVAEGCAVQLGAICNEQNPSTELADRARHEGLPASVIACRGRFDFSTLRAIRRLVSESCADVVHTHGYKADLYGWLATRGRTTRMLATCHNWTGDSLAVRWYARLDRAVLSRFDNVVPVSGSVAGKLKEAGMAEERLCVIGNGIDTDAFAKAVPSLRDGLPTGRLVIGAVGRLVENKGFEYLLRAMAGLLAAHPETTLILVGDGPDRGRLESLGRELGIGDSVVFTGTRSDMAAVYRSFDLFVLPSLNEGSPMAVIEAMAAGVPVVASAVGGLPAMIDSGRNGILVPARDAAALQREIGRLIKDRPACERMAAEGVKTVRERHSARQMAQHYLSLYKAHTPQAAAVAGSTPHEVAG